ncbi:MAG: hypothetical protein M3Q65_25540 [Chloroflexota bacterium]|nr:hypothetical protein [Chloroflexota bacterium]
MLERYAWLYNLETVQGVRRAHAAAIDPAERERLRRVYHYLLDGYVERQTAGAEDAVVTFEMNATVAVDGEEIAYYDLPALLAEEPDFDRRDRLRAAALAVVERTNPDRLAIWRVRLATLADDFGYADYTAYTGAKKGIAYGPLRARLAAFLARTEAAYTARMGRWVEQATGRRLGEIGGHHLAHLSRLPRYDAYFSAERLLEVYARTLAGLGLDPRTQRNIHLDIADRPLKHPRPICYVPDPPGEVHLVIKPQGGLEDYAAFLHEAGHAQHYGNTDPALDYISRAIPTSFALTEVYSFLLQFLTTSPAWLREVAGLPDEAAREVAYYTRLAQLAAVRRYAAKLAYELDFFADPLDEARNRDLYRRTLTPAIGFSAPPQGYLDDLDPDLYTADYLRAWLTEAMLRHHLEREYGESWFGRPARAGRTRTSPGCSATRRSTRRTWLNSSSRSGMRAVRAGARGTWANKHRRYWPAVPAGRRGRLAYVGG